MDVIIKMSEWTAKNVTSMFTRYVVSSLTRKFYYYRYDDTQAMT